MKSITFKITSAIGVVRYVDVPVDSATGALLFTPRTLTWFEEDAEIERCEKPVLLQQRRVNA